MDCQENNLAAPWEPLDWRGGTKDHVVVREEKPKKMVKPKQASKKQSPDPTKPKRMLTAFNLFFQHHRQQVLASLPEKDESERPSGSHGKISFADLAREISKRWKLATREEKAHFQVLSDQDKKRYQREMKEWKSKEKSKWGTFQGFDETRLLDKDHLDHLAMVLGDDCTRAFVRAFR